MSDPGEADRADFDWSKRVASLAVGTLLVAKLIAKEHFERAVEIVAEEIYVRLALSDRPSIEVAANRRRIDDA